MKFLYTVWFRNDACPEDDPDFEWPACFVIVAATAELAKEWGEHLSERYATDSDQSILSSAVEPVEGSTMMGDGKLPVVLYGEEASKAKIGW